MSLLMSCWRLFCQKLFYCCELFKLLFIVQFAMTASMSVYRARLIYLLTYLLTYLAYSTRSYSQTLQCISRHTDGQIETLRNQPTIGLQPCTIMFESMNRQERHILQTAIQTAGRKQLHDQQWQSGTARGGTKLRIDQKYCPLLCSIRIELAPTNGLCNRIEWDSGDAGIKPHIECDGMETTQFCYCIQLK